MAEGTEDHDAHQREPLPPVCRFNKHAMAYSHRALHRLLGTSRVTSLLQMQAGPTLMAASASASASVSTEARALVSQSGARGICTLYTLYNSSSCYPPSPQTHRSSRSLSSSSWPRSEDSTSADQSPPKSAKVLELADRIIELNMLEVSELTDVLKDRLNITGGLAMGMPMGMPMAVGGGAPGGAAAPAVEAAEEKTDDFTVKLTGFDAASKIKVIKEVRAVTDLGLKEAKEMVEKSPCVVKEGLSKDDAEALVKKLEAVGATVAME